MVIGTCHKVVVISVESLTHFYAQLIDEDSEANVKDMNNGLINFDRQVLIIRFSCSFLPGHSDI